MGDGILGVPWWVLVILVVAAVAGTMAGRSMGRAKAQRWRRKSEQRDKWTLCGINPGLRPEKAG